MALSMRAAPEGSNLLLIMTDRNYVEIDLRNLLSTVFPLNLSMGRCF